MMSVLMCDAKADLQDIHGIHLDTDFICHEIIYADDTLLIDYFGENLQAYMECVAEQGKSYGLRLNFSKVECMPVRCESSIKDPDGKLIQAKDKLKYLGVHLAADGSTTSELAQKLGQAEHDFKALRQVWNHSNISRQFKYQIYIACVVQKLLCGLEGAWINAAGKRKLDGFHARCLRRILHISPAFISHVTNAYVLQQLAAYPLSAILLERQMLYFGHVARSAPTSTLFKSLFQNDKWELRESVRKQGRPRDTWNRKIMAEILQMCGGRDKLIRIFSGYVHSSKRNSKIFFSSLFMETACKKAL